MSGPPHLAVQPSDGGPIRTFDAYDVETLFAETAYGAERNAERHALAMGLDARITHPAGAGTLSIETSSYEELDALLAGERPERRGQVMTDLDDLVLHHDMLIDRTDLALILALGLDPFAAIHFALTFHDLAPESCDAPRLIAADGSAELWLSMIRRHDGRLHLDATCATLAPGCRWDRGSILVEGLPETAAYALPGRPLSDLVRHPIVDPLGLDIMAVTHSDGCHTVLTTHRPTRG